MGGANLRLRDRGDDLRVLPLIPLTNSTAPIITLTNHLFCDSHRGEVEWNRLLRKGHGTDVTQDCELGPGSRVHLDPEPN